MAFEYGCFISYRHLPGIEDFVRLLARDIKRELDSYGISALQVFLDEDRIRPGDVFNMSIPNSLCKSIVMIVVYVPAYFNEDKPYCTKEFVAFVEHEKRRLTEVAQKYPDYKPEEFHQVIPIVLKKNKDIPIPSELDDRAPIYWQEEYAYDRPGVFAKTNKYLKKKREICDRILHIWNRIPELDVLADCQQFADLPDDQHPLFKKLVQPSSIPAFP